MAWVPNDVSTFTAAGTNNEFVVGDMEVTNETAGGADMGGILYGVLDGIRDGVNKGAGLEDSDLSLNLNYIEIPVLLRYEFKEDGGPFAYVGPYVGFVANCSTSADTPATATPTRRRCSMR